MTSKYFEIWFAKTFGIDAPKDYLEFLTKNPKNVNNGGRGGILWDAEYVVSQTEDYEAAENGFCMIGGGDSLTHYLLSAKDGRVLVVDSRDHHNVDAWFSSIDTMISLMNFNVA